MKVQPQSAETLLGQLRRLEVDWRDDTSRKACKLLEQFPIKNSYEDADVDSMLRSDFDLAKLIFRLFLGMSKDSFEATLVEGLGRGKAGKLSFKKEPATYVEYLVGLGLLDAMYRETHRSLVWSDVLVERLRSGRGSAVSGQKRGRMLEDRVEEVIKALFTDNYRARINFTGHRKKTAKCDFAIPAGEQSSIVIEAKGYDATGSKMSDVIGDIRAIIDAKRSDTAFLLVTDGVSWLQRRSDFNKIIEFQNQGDITRIYTLNMLGEFRDDLQTLAAESGLL